MATPVDLRIKLEGIEQMLADINSMRAELHKSNKELDAQRIAHRKIKEEIAETRKTNNGATEEQKARLREVKGLLSQQNELLRKTKRGIEEKRIAVSNERLEYTKLARSVREADKAQQNLNKTNRVTATLVRQTWQYFSYMFGVYGAIRLVGNTIKTIREFEVSLKKVQAVLDATDNEMQQLGKTAIAISDSGIFSPAQITEIYLELAKLGFSIREVIDSSEGILKLATATGESVSASAELTASVIRGFGMDASETTKIVDIMGSAFVSSALDLEKFRESIKYIGPVADRLGFTFAQVSSILGKLADAQIAGSLAGTSLRNIFGQIADRSSALSQRLGGNIVTFEDFVLALKGLKDSGTSLAEVFKLVDKRAVTTLSVMIESSDQLLTYAEAMENASGAMDEMVETQMQSLDYQLKRLNNSWKSLILSMQDSGGVLTDTARILNTILRALQPRVIETPFDNYRDAWQRRVDAVFTRKDIDEIEKLNDDFLFEMDRLNKQYDSLYKKAQLDSRLVETLQPMITETKRQLNVLMDEYGRFGTFRQRMLDDSLNAELDYDKALHQLYTNRIKYTEASFSEMKKIEEELHRFNVLEIEKTAEDQKMMDILLEAERLRHLDVLRGIVNDEKNYWDDINRTVIEGAREFGLNVIILGEERLAQAKETAKKVREALSVVFKNEDEEYADDIPFDTEAIVKGLDKELDLDNILRAADLFTNAFEDMASAVVSAIDRIVDRYDTMVSETQSALDTEMRLMEMGYANNVSAKQKELAELKALREEALKDQAEAVRQQQLLESIAQGVNIASAASGILRTAGATGALGLLVAPGLLAALFALWRQAKVQAVQSAYPEFGEGGWITGPSHKKGGVNINAEGGEFMVNKDEANRSAATKKFLMAFNEGKIDLDRLLLERENITVVDLDGSRNLNEMNKNIRKLAQGGRQYDHFGGYTIERSGIRTRKIYGS